MYVYFQTTNDMNEGNTRNYQSVGIKHRKNITLLFTEMFVQATSQWRN